MKTKGSTIVET